MKNGKFVIEKNVPVISVKTGTGAKYPWDKMEPGDSFLMEGAKRLSAQRLANQTGKIRGWHVATRWDEKAQAIRVWRLS